MINQFPAWKNLLVVVVLTVGVVLALPNIFGEDPSVQVGGTDRAELDQAAMERILTVLEEEEGLVPHRYGMEEGQLVLRFEDGEQQDRAQVRLRAELGRDFQVAVYQAPAMPDWMREIGLRPMNLGLDLRGGVHFLLQVDMEAVVEQAVERFDGNVRSLLRDERIRYTGIEQGERGFTVYLRDDGQRSSTLDRLSREFPELDVSEGDEANAIRVVISDDEIEEAQRNALEQNRTTLRNRVDELGVAEPLVQRQNPDRIVVQLPGVQDTTRAKDILGATAQLEFRLVDEDNDPYRAEETGRVPPGSRLYQHRDGYPVLLKRDVIATGDQLTGAGTGFDEDSGRPMVTVNLDSQGGRRMGETTRENLGRGMAVVYRERVTETRIENGEEVRESQEVEEVISVATIQGIFSNRFRITNLEGDQARNLALLLRAGALAAPVDIIEERTVGASLGQDNIEAGIMAISFGFLLVVIFMLIYYKVFGLVANLALFFNLIMVVGLLSALGATLTLPGIAGIVLTVGMAVDANVLIFERIREEIKAGNTPQAAIFSGYEKAFSTIADANITTLIAALVLFSFGTGPIQGFAITLSLGIMCSMFTAILGTRAAVNLIYGNRKVKALSI
ncbi:preprotein translocase subunit SecD [Natronospira proteinivora]|uniref:Protein translocase subunit SecD n=1 Tax=Natronospira proteinivora TaxID=1807133 RepID=A0ABT1G5P6_9GAMM|nr:protein translocase subunit SecD [Natronospira proteinivora]MCP1726265.1 preprotein translocase subunit SecD [Natronospira proteinivora]